MLIMTSVSQVKQTLVNIRAVLKHRQEAWEEAKLIKEQTQTTENLEKYLDDKDVERGAARISISRDSDFFNVSSVPEDLPTSARLSSVPEDLPSGRASSVPEYLPESNRDSAVSGDSTSPRDSQGRPILPPRPT